MPCQGNGVYQQEGCKPRRKSGAAGFVLIVLGLLGLIFGAFEYSVYSRNKDTLEWNQAWDADTPEQHELVEFQYRVTIAAFTVGAILIMFGVSIMASAYSYNRELDRVELLEAVKGATKPFSPNLGARAFCESCGAKISPTDRFCRSCGKRF